MSSDSAKRRRKVGGDDHVVVGDTAQMDDMEQRLSELESRCTSLEDKCNSLEDKCNSLEGKNNVLDARCGSLERCVEILMKAQIWEYSARPIPRSHWVELGLDEDDIDRVEIFADNIMDITCDLRSGDVDGREIHLHGAGMIHDDVLLPHWKEFADALQLLQLSKDSDYSLVISDVQLTSSVINILTPALVGKSIKTIQLENNRFMNIREGIDFAIKCMKSNQTLESFGWANTQMDNIDDVNHMVRVIISHSSIKKVRLENCFGENINSHVVLCTLLDSEKQFTSIDFDGNNIQTGGGTEIPDFIATNPPLADLLLESNHLNDEDAVLIARALKHNTSLKSLNLGINNKITKIGIRVLANVVYDSTSLNAAYNCNHTCNLEGLDFGSNMMIGNIMMNLGGRPYARASKMIHLMSLGNIEGSNVHRLNLEFKDEDDEYSLALVPKVLESVHRYFSGYFDITRTRNYWSARDTCVPHLSIMYEILSSWKMPELFETSRTTKQTNSKHK